MRKREQLIIKFAGLKPGHHNFNFSLGNKFFESIESELIKVGEITVNADLNKLNELIQINFDFSGEVGVSCDRCLADARIPVEGKDNLLVRFGLEEQEDDPNQVILPTGESEIDVTQFVFEMIALSLPVRIIPCEIRNDKSICDKETLERLGMMENLSSSGNSINIFSEKLKDLKKKNK